MRKSIHGIVILIFLSMHHVMAQESYADRAKKYVKQYAAYAIADQRSSGVPASITLGQGLLETEAGISELATEANNHFGIKCKNGWTGPTILHTDDAKNECFKKYESALESYNDHSAHLHRNPRYKPLFKHSVTDYASWAHGLKKCGYATNPRYAQQLIKIIEDYKLQQYTYAALDSTYELPGEEEELIVETRTDPPKAETTFVKDPLEPAITRTVVTTTATTVKTISVARRATGTENTAVKEPTTDAIPVKTKIETSKTGMVAASPVTTNPANKNVATGTDTTETDNSPYLEEQPIEDTDAAEGVQMVNGLRAIRVRRDEALLPYAVKYKIRYAHLLEMNDLPDQPLAFDSWIYLEKKNPTGTRERHIVREGETLIQIAQQEGMQLKRLAALNLLNPYEQPVTGTVLNLRTIADKKPEITDYKAPRELPKDEVAAKVPATESSAVSAKAKYATTYEKVAPDSTKEKSDGLVKQPFMKEDPPQRQMNKPVPAPSYSKEDKKYVVKRGETAYSIAKKHHITVKQLLDWNHLDPQDLKAGQTLIIKQ